MHTSAISLPLPVHKTTHVPESGDFQNKKTTFKTKQNWQLLFEITHSRPSDVLSTPMPSFTPLTKEPWQAGEWKRKRWEQEEAEVVGGRMSKFFLCTFVTVSKDCPCRCHFAREQDTLWGWEGMQGEAVNISWSKTTC